MELSFAMKITATLFRHLAIKDQNMKAHGISQHGKAPAAVLLQKTLEMILTQRLLLP